ncbi:MAG: hypothetical protein H0T79_02615 [Deltaproteobacteria bacterium]|nr:hypothetical protein [Deltaproteobacteria bacterium]
MKDARLIFVECTGAEARTVTVETRPLLSWLWHMPASDARVAWRTADVGAIILAEVIVVSRHEATVATTAARLEAVRTDVKDADLLRFCDQVEALIATPKPVEYFNAWLIIETADID